MNLDRLKELYEKTEDKFEKQLLFAEIRSIEISNSIIIDRNLPTEIVDKIDEIENGRAYYNYKQSYTNLVRFGGTLSIFTASEEELQQLSLSERKIANIYTYGRVNNPQDIEEYVQCVLQQYYLNEENFMNQKKYRKQASAK
jgi:hypothetical protein